MSEESTTEALRLPLLGRALRFTAGCLAWLVAAGCTVWAFGALHFDFPVAKAVVACGWLLAVVAGVVFLRGPWRKLGAPLAGFVLVLGWWLTLRPTHDADWQPDVARLPRAEIQGDVVTLHNVRNVDYRTTSDYTPRWETRAVRISQLTAVDMAITYWGSPWMAHPIVSFQFADAPPVCFSIETRKKVGQSYSAIGGFYRQFALIYIVADERDVIRVRSNYREGEEVYLYRLTLTPEQARERFREYLEAINQLHEQPRWYNAITANCTTSIRHQHPATERAKWDWRILANGKGDELLYERQALVTGGLPFPELRQNALINAAAQAAGQSPDFSHLIRANRPGFTSPSPEK